MNTADLLKSYITEKIGAEFIFHEFGFIVYTLAEDSVRINHIFVHEDSREENIATDLFLQVIEIAKANNLKRMVCSTNLEDGNPRVSMLAILKWFEPVDAHNNIIVFKRELS